MIDPMSQPAPADKRADARWRVWKVIFAYLAMAGLALASIVFIDSKVKHHVPLTTAPATTAP